MKRKHTNRYLGFLIVLVAIACTKEITDDLIKTFSIQFTETTVESFLNISKSAEFRIEGVQSADMYEFKYSVTKGAGFLTINSERIEPDVFISLPQGLLYTIEYTGTTIDENIITIVVRDSFGNEQEASVTFKVLDTKFDIEATPSLPSAYIGGTIDLDGSITDKIDAADYTVSFTFIETDTDKSGSGVISVDGQIIEEGTRIDIEDNQEFSWQLEGITTGNVTIVFTAESSLGTTADKKLEIPVTETPDFTFTAVSEVSELPTNVETTIDFELLETVGNSEYILTLTTNNTATFIYDGVVYESGGEIPITIGTSSGIYTGMVMGNHEIIFTVANSSSTPVEKMATIAIEYTDPDTEGPVIVLNGEEEITIQVGEEFDDPGVTATDNIDDPVAVEVTENIDINVPGEYIVTYTATDSSMNSSSVTRTVIVIDDEAPKIELIGDNPLQLLLGTTFNDPGVTITDNLDTEEMLQDALVVTGTVNENEEGSYTIIYTVRDSSDNEVSVERTVNVVNDAPPVITILGDNPLTFNARATYDDAGARVTDDVDEGLTIQTDDQVISDDPGNYTVIYTVTDSANNPARAVREVIVIDNEAPVITLSVTGTMITHSAKTPFTIPTATVTDNANDPLTAILSGTVNINVLDDYVLTWTAEDKAGNKTEKKLTVRVIDDVAPVITLPVGPTITHRVNTPFSNPVATITDNFDTSITAVVSGAVNINRLGDNELTYTAEDQSGNSSNKKLIVRVIDDVAPVITITGQSTVSVNAGDNYNDQGATATDNFDGNITSSITTSGTFSNTLIPGEYTIIYSVEDTSGNMTNETRTINVRSVTPSYDNGSRELRANPGTTVTYSISGNAPSGVNYLAYVQFRRDALGGARLTTCGNGTITQNNPNLTNRTFVMPDSGRVFIRTSIDGPINASASGTVRISGNTFNYSVTRFADGHKPCF